MKKKYILRCKNNETGHEWQSLPLDIVTARARLRRTRQVLRVVNRDGSTDYDPPIPHLKYWIEEVCDD